jgi:hypothetical protein
VAVPPDGFRLSLYVDGRRRWTSSDALLSVYLAVAREKVICSGWSNEPPLGWTSSDALLSVYLAVAREKVICSGWSNEPPLVVLDAKTGHRSHGVAEAVTHIPNQNFGDLTVVGDEFLIVRDLADGVRVLLLDDVLAVRPTAAVAAGMSAREVKAGPQMRRRCACWPTVCIRSFHC